MLDNIKKILFIASIAFNVVLVTTYAIYKLPLISGVDQPAAPNKPLFLLLDLAPDQLKQFSAERERFHSLLLELGPQIRTKQIELIDLLETTPPDPRTIQEKQGEIQRLQGAVQDRVISHFLQASAFLATEQRKRFFSLIKERIQTSAQACPPWMGSFEQGRPQESKNEFRGASF